jgi:nucleotide-binding universal stress UspA family protein
VRLVTVLEPLPGYVQMAVVVDPAMPETLRIAKHAQLVDLQTRACEKARAHGLNMATIIVESSEGSGLLNAIRMASPDLLVIGRQAHASSIEFAGTVRGVVNKTTCPVLAVA